MTPLTALDIVGIPAWKVSDRVYRHACPACGADAWSGRYHTQCVNPACSSVVMSPLDILALSFKGDYAKAEARAATALRRAENQAAATLRKTQRRVLDFWLGCCQADTTMSVNGEMQRLETDGLALRFSGFSAKVLSNAQIAELIELGKETGATVPESWATAPPSVGTAYCVQTTPHTIDRIVFLRKGETDVTWRRFRSGITGMIGLSPLRPRFLTADTYSALRVQNSRSVSGRADEVASVFIDAWCAPPTDNWCPDAQLFTVAVGSANDVDRVQRVTDDFPAMESSLNATLLEPTIRGCVLDAVPWPKLRVGYILKQLNFADPIVTPAAAQLFESTGARVDDANAILERLRHHGHLLLAEDFYRLTENKTIFKDPRVEVRESSGDYSITTFGGRSQITNFTLRLSDNVRFRDRSDTYLRGNLRCGTLSREVVIRHSVLSGKAAKLQEELHGCLILPGEGVAFAQVPTVVDTPNFQKYIIPHLNRQMASLPMTEGISRLGWSADRKTFHLPGMTVGVDGRTNVPTIFYPGVLTLRAFGSVSDWADTCPTSLSQSCQDLIAIMVATVVRYYKRCVSKPVCVLQTSDAVTLLEGLVRAVGQSAVFDMGTNVRDVANVDGVNGYPFLASGYGHAQLLRANLPYIVLTDEGYRVTGDVDQAQVEAGGRALQYALLRVVEWCLATGADDFKEVAAAEHHASLMREGQWLVQNVCDLQPWEISVNGMLELERILAQIPPGDTARRLTLIDGVRLQVDMQGVEWDLEKLTGELSALDAELEVAGDVLSAQASALLPAIASFYGAEPELTLLNS